MLPHDIDNEVEKEFDDLSKRLQLLEAEMNKKYQKTPEKILDDLEKKISNIQVKLDGLPKNVSQSVQEILDILKNGVYFDSTENISVIKTDTNKSRFFLPTTQSKKHGVIDGIFYDTGDVVFYSAKTGRIYVIAAKDYVSSITLPSGKTEPLSTGQTDIQLTAEDLNIVEVPDDSLYNTPCLRRQKSWEALNSHIKTASETEYGIARQAADQEITDSRNPAKQTSTISAYVTLRQALAEIYRHAVYTEKLAANKTYIFTNKGLVEAPDGKKYGHATTTVEGLTRFANSNEISNADPDLAMKPDNFVAAVEKGVVIASPKKNASKPLQVYAMQNGTWQKINSIYDPKTFNYIKATENDHGLVKVARVKDLESPGLSSENLAVSAENFLKFIADTPIEKTKTITQTGDYIYKDDRWQKTDAIQKATDSIKGQIQFATTHEIENGKPDNEPNGYRALDQKTLEAYLTSRVNMAGVLSNVTDPTAIYGFQKSLPVKISINRAYNAKATLSDLGTFRKAEYTNFKELLKKIISNEPLSLEEQHLITTHKNDVIDMSFMEKFLTDFKVVDKTFIPPSENKKYAIYNGDWVEVTGSKNETEVERPNGSKHSAIKDTVLFIKKDLVPSDTVGKEGDICYVLNTHALALPETKAATAHNTTTTSTWKKITKSYYLDKVNNRWIPIKVIYVKVKDTWQRVHTSKYKTA